MKKKILIAVISIALAIGLYIGLGFAVTKKSIELVGNRDVSVEVFSEYNEQGAVATVKHPLFFGFKKTIPVDISGEVNTKTLGSFTVKYTADNLTAERTVKVIDTKAPILTFDEEFAKATGTNTNLYNTVIACLTSITVVLGMRMMGTLLISALIIFPAISAMKIFKTFKKVIIASVIIALTCFILGLIISFVFSLPTGATVVSVNIIFFALTYLLRR